MSLDRAQALALLHQWTQSPGLRKHALGVEAAMRAYAPNFDADPEAWGIVGLLHDFDYERYPTPADHPFRGVEELRRHGVPEEWTEAILGHAQYSGVPRVTPLAKTLFAVDELVGFLTACALVQPDKSIAAVRVPSVLKKLKDKAFAKTVSRDDIRQGAAELGVELEQHIAFVQAALIDVAPELGLR
ncbi:MAG TPA: HDIG domain-containing protein [Acidobacteriota bacterium]|jgi:putative nucleotidyltransferase with HDIG domain